MKRKYLSLLLCIAMLLSVLSACTSDSSEEAGSKGESDTPKVSDSQIEFDMPDLLEYLDDEEDFPWFEDFDHWEAVQHTYNEDMHTDTVQVNLFYSTSWFETERYIVNLIYQYSRDNDLWTMIGNNGAEYIDTEYPSDLTNKLVGRFAEATWEVTYGLYDYSVITVHASIESIDIAAETMVIEYYITQDGNLICDETETVVLTNQFYLKFDCTLKKSDSFSGGTDKKSGTFDWIIDEDSDATGAYINIDGTAALKF